MRPITLPAPINRPLLANTIAQEGYIMLSPDQVTSWVGCTLSALIEINHFWQDMPIDSHLKDAGQYRRRRHSSFIYEQGQIAQTPHRAHWQSLNYNALHGGMQRWFEPIEPALVNHAAWQQLLQAFGALAASSNKTNGIVRSCIEAHQFRIDTANGIGRPTPEGAHRDGVDLVAVFLVNRQLIRGGETRIFHNDSSVGVRFTLTEPWSLVLLDDARVTHETSPIQPLNEALAKQGYRDTLVLTCKAGSFQEPA